MNVVVSWNYVVVTLRGKLYQMYMGAERDAFHQAPIYAEYEFGNAPNKYRDAVVIL